MTEAEAWSRVRRADLLLDARRYDEAIAEAGQALAESPDNLAAQLVLTRALLGAGRKFDALREAERAVRLGPDSAQAQIVLAQAATALHRLDRADRATKEACRLAPHWAWAHYLRMRSLLDHRDVASARKEAAEILALDPAGSLGHIAQGELALHQQAWAAAERSFRAALAIEPNNATVLINLGVALSRQGKQSAAIEAYTNAGNLDPTSRLVVQNILGASQRHLMSPASRRTLLGTTLRLLWLAGWFALGVFISESAWAAATALGVILAVFLGVLFVTPYRRMRNLPDTARRVLTLSRQTSGEREWSKRFGAHPLAGPAFLLLLALGAGLFGYVSNSSGSTNGSAAPELVGPVVTQPEKPRLVRSPGGAFSVRVPSGWTTIDYASPNVASELTRLQRHDPGTYAILTGLAASNSQVRMVLMSGDDDTEGPFLTTVLLRSWPFAGTLDRAESAALGTVHGTRRYVHLPVGSAVDTVSTVKSDGVSGTQEDYVFLAGGDVWDFTFYLFGTATPPKPDAGAATIVRTFSMAT
jgi:tetratricopeptide (TPR) repeat protein